MKKVYWVFNIVGLPVMAIYVCYANIENGSWENALMFGLLSVLSIGNYLAAFGEPHIRANENEYQDQHINQALRKCEELEQSVHKLQLRATDQWGQSR